MSDIESFREKLQSLIAKFEKDKTHYLSKGYPEAQVDSIIEKNMTITKRC